MSFLAPLFLLGGLALALPVLFHLIRRSSRERQRFSSLMFLEPSPPRVTRRSRIEQWLLLLLRCAVLALLAFGFARPFLNRASLAQSVQKGRDVLILIDASASMRREDLWAQAQATALRELRGTTPADAVALGLFDQSVQMVLPFDQAAALEPAARAAQADARLKSIEPGWSGTHLGAALVAGADLLDQARHGATNSSGAQRELIVISDFQEGARLDGLQGHAWPPRFQVRLLPVRATNTSNAGLHLLTGGAGTPDHSRLQINNTRAAQHSEFQVGWVDAAGRSTGPLLAAQVPPGETRTLGFPDGAGLGRSLRLTGDLEPFDNTAYFVNRQQTARSVIYLGEDAAPGGARYFLEQALGTGSNALARLLPLGTDGAIPADASLIVVNAIPSATQLDRMQRALIAGQTVLFLLRTPNQLPTLRLLSQYDALSATEAALTGYTMLGEVRFDDSLLEAFSEPRFSDFTRIHFWKYRKLGGLGTNATTLARFENGDPAWVRMPVGKGTLFLFTSGLEAGESQLALSSKFVPLLGALMEEGTGAATAQRSHAIVGDDVALPPGGAVRISGPIGRGAVTVTNRWVPAMPGVYELRQGTRTWFLAVNLAPAESRIAPLDPGELKSRGVPMAGSERVERPTSATSPSGTEGLELEGQQQLWRWLLAAAALLLLVETGVSGYLSRRVPASRAPL